MADGVVTEEPTILQISAPIGRHPRPRPGVRLYRRLDLERMVRPGAPPRTRVEVSVIDAADVSTSLNAVLSLVFAATQGRFTTAARLRTELGRRSRHRWRRILLAVLTDVERVVELTRDGRRHRDVRYLAWCLVVELDGRQAHPDSQRHRDHQRDNRVVVDEAHDVLRYGWHAVALTPCDVARQVVTMLRRHGWPGTPHTCPNCR